MLHSAVKIPISAITIILFLQNLAFASLTDEMSPLVEEVGQIIKEKYIIDGIQTQYLKNSAVDGMLRGLDPYSGYYTEEEFKEFQNNYHLRLINLFIICLKI